MLAWLWLFACKLYICCMRYLLLFALLPFLTTGQNQYQFAVVKYNGGGDWYANPTSLTNLISFCNEELGMRISPKYATVEVGSEEIFDYPFVHLTGHGNVVFSDAEMENLRVYLESGGFLHVDDNYGMDKFIRPLLEQLIPNSELEELGADHPIFSTVYSLPDGLPKIHEHDAERPQAFGLYYNGRLVMLYTFESDLGDGWEDADVHNDSEEIRRKALRMGANIISYVLTGQ
jgi:hypothetical protein